MSWRASLSMVLILEPEPKIEKLHYIWQQNQAILKQPKKLLQHKANIEDLDDNQMTPLLYSANHGHIEITKILLAAGANPLARNKYDWTVLHFSAAFGNAEICDLLIKKNNRLIDALTKFQESALHVAAIFGKIEAVKLLLKHGATIDLKNDNGKIPFDLALEHKQQQVVDLLKNAIFSPLEKKVFEIGLNPGTSLVNFFGFANEEKFMEAIETCTAIIHFAVVAGNIDLVHKLIERKANIEALDKNQMTPLHYSAEDGHIALTKILLDAGANPLAKDEDNCTALHMSAENGYAEICEILLKKSPSLIHALDVFKMSALHYAAYRGKIEAVKVLLQHGAIIDLKNDDGETPLDLALKENQQEVVDFLKNWKSE